MTKHLKPTKQNTALDKPAQWPDSTRPTLTFLPAKVRGARNRQKATRETLLGAGVLLLLTAGAYGLVAGSAGSANASLDHEKAVAAQHQATLQKDSPFTDYFSGFEERKAAAAQAMENDVSYAKVLRAVNDANTFGITFTSMSTESTDGLCSPGEMFVPSVSLGCFTINGYGPSLNSVSSLVSALGKSKTALSDPYVSESAVGDGRATFKLTVGYNEQALSHKDKKILPDEPIEPAEPKETVAP